MKNLNDLTETEVVCDALITLAAHMNVVLCFKQPLPADVVNTSRALADSAVALAMATKKLCSARLTTQDAPPATDHPSPAKT